MKILIIGGTGLVGKNLVQHLKKYFPCRFLFISRSKSKLKKTFPLESQSSFFECNISQSSIPQDALLDVDAIINLSGESIVGKRWNKKQKQLIYESRVSSAKNIFQSLSVKKHNVKTLIAASAIGYYGDSQDKELNESAPCGNDFMAQLCKDWEENHQKCSSLNIRTVCIRIGLVLSTEGGILGRMLPIFRKGLGGSLANGQSWMSWIHIHDLNRLFSWILENESTKGIYNGVSPHPVQNNFFTYTLGKTLSRPAFFPLPLFLLKILFGEVYKVLIASQKVIPQRALEEHFSFSFSDIGETFKDLLKKRT